MARRATRLSPKALLRLRQKLVDEGLYEEDRPEDTIGNRIRPISDSLEGPVVPIPGSYYVFRYMAKTPEIKFDLNPLVQVTEVFSYGFIAYNFHWGRNRKYTYSEVQGGLYEVTADELKDLELIPFQNFQMKPPEELEKAYNNTGGLPANLRYPYAMIDSGMDFLKIQIATYTPPQVELQGLLDVPKTEDITGANLKTGDITLGDKAKGGGFALNTATSANTINTGAGRALKRPKHTIYLPIPRQIQDANSVTYNDGTLDPLEAVGAALISQGIENPTFDRVQDTFNLLANEGLDVMNMNTDAIAAAIAGRAIGALGGNVTANALIARASGAILNPNLESLFQGVKLRQFPFVFEFFPRNGREAEEVKNIIKVLKRSMAPRNNKEEKSIHS